MRCLCLIVLLFKQQGINHKHFHLAYLHIKQRKSGRESKRLCWFQTLLSSERGREALPVLFSERTCCLRRVV